jgi:hypothetical protein
MDGVDVVTMTMLSPADAIAEIAASSPGPRVICAANR